MQSTNNLQPMQHPIYMGLYPTLGSLQEVMDFADSKLPITNKNDLIAILYTYHNTMLKELSCK